MLAIPIIATAHHACFGLKAFVTFPDNLFVSSITTGHASREPEMPGPLVCLIATAVRHLLFSVISSGLLHPLFSFTITSTS